MDEYINAHPEAASGHEILCTRDVGDPDLAFSPDRLARRAPQAPLHTNTVNLSSTGDLLLRRKKWIKHLNKILKALLWQKGCWQWQVALFGVMPIRLELHQLASIP